MKNILQTILFVLAAVALHAQGENIMYGVNVSQGDAKVTMYAVGGDLNANPGTQLTSALFTFTLPTGTAIVPGGNMLQGINGTWEVTPISAADLPATAPVSVQGTDVYAVSFSGDIGLDVSASDSLPLFCFVITNGCEEGGTINVLDSMTAVDLETSFGGQYNFEPYFALMMTDASGSKCIMDRYDSNVSGADMPACPPPLIPTMGQWALFVFGLIVFTLGVVVVWNVHTAKRQVE